VSIGGEDAKAVQVLLHISSNRCDIPVGVESVQFLLLGVEVNDGFGLLIEDLQSLSD
jgi:hypothetical protein